MLRLPLRQLRRAAVVAVVLVAGACPPASAGPATDRLREFFGRVNAVLADPATEDRPLERLDQIRRMVRDLVDIRAAAADSLGSSWDARTTAEREEFVALFAGMLERAYVARFAGAVRGSGRIEPVYGEERLRDSDAVVGTRVRSGSGELAVEYRMTGRDGRWRVRDVVIDGVSTVGNYRAQFRRLGQDGGHVALVRHLRAKLDAESLLFARADRPVAIPPALPPSPPAVTSTPEPTMSVATASPRPPAATTGGLSSSTRPPTTAKKPAPTSTRPPAVVASAVPTPAPTRQPAATMASAPSSPAIVPRPVSAHVPSHDPAVTPTATRGARAKPASAPPVTARDAIVTADPIATRPRDFGQWLVAGAFVVGTAAVCRRWRASAR